MLKIKSLTVKNFMSVGNVSQAISFAADQLVLVLGENLDQGGNDNRNGTGKSTSINALSYALYGEALVKIKKDNLVNKVNGSNMLVCLDFEKDGAHYRIERGRKPNIFKFYTNGNIFSSEETNEAQGENKDTQSEVERILGISYSMFKQIVALNTYSEPFLSLRANDQRDIVEQLLGITKLTEKAVVLSENLKNTKNDIKEEEFRLRAIDETNNRILANIQSMQTKANAWDVAKTNKLQKLTNELAILSEIDIEHEILSHKTNIDCNETLRMQETLSKDIRVTTHEINRHNKSISELNNKLAQLGSEIKTCPTCSSKIGEDLHNSLIASAETELRHHTDALATANTEKSRLEAELSKYEDCVLIRTFYNSLSDAYDHKTSVETLKSEITSLAEQTNPYLNQIDSLKATSIQELNYEKMNDLVALRDHQEFLLKLLTSKDSFIRKKIIDHNIQYLNSRLTHYLEKIGLPHQVKFKSDLDVEITQYGRDFDFDNLSRGERTRLILSLSWAFRDVFEGLNGKINLLFIDELIDNGLDSSGVESALGILKKMTHDCNRVVFLISHRDELIGRVNSIMKVVKSSGFTTFEISESTDS